MPIRRTTDPEMQVNRRRRVPLVMTFMLLSLVLGSSIAFAAGTESPSASSSLPATIDPVTDPVAAEELPKIGLDREQAKELLQEVFGAELEVPAEFFDELDVEAFRSDQVALIDSPASGAPAGLLSSTLPLRAENEADEKELIDLDLKQEGQHFEPENPLVDVEIPTELGEGVSIPSGEIRIDFGSGQLDRSASEAGDATAFFPNVRAQTDVVITALPTGVETYTQLRSPEAPNQQSYDLSFPAGSSLVPTKAGGAEVVGSDGDTLLSVSAPWAMDAQGNQVPTVLSVDTRSISVSVDPPADAAYPILVDPVFETYDFTSVSNPVGGRTSEWTGYSEPGFWYAWGYPNYGMNVYAQGGATTSSGSQAMFNYYVPRYWTDVNAGLSKPTSFIRNMKLWDLNFMEPDETSVPANNRPAYPFMQLNLWDEAHNQAVWTMHRYGNEGQWTDTSYVFDMTNPNENPDAKHGGFAIASFDTRNAASRYVNVKRATVEVTDKDAPSWSSMLSPSGWMNQTSKPTEYSVGDLGLGVYQLRVSQPQASGGTKSVWTGFGCTGSAFSPCPRNATDLSPGVDRAAPYEAGTMAQGENVLTAYAVDPVLNTSAARLVKVKVDHTAPQLGLSGNLTEQASVGSNLHEYTLNYNATDGDEATAAAQGPLGSQGTGAGQLERPLGIAVDSVGNVWVADKTNNRVVEYDPTGKLLRELSSGTTDGKISDPRDVAVGPNGNIWVAEFGNKRLQQFNPSGAFVSKISNAAFVEPWGLDFGPEGSLWVADTAAKRVFKFSQAGVLEFSESSTSVNSGSPVGVAVDAFGNPWIAFQGTDRIVEVEIRNGKLREAFGFGGTGTAAGQFNSPVGIAIAPSGNILVSDGLNGRIQDFKPDGTFLRQYGAVGGAAGQLSSPRAIAIDASGQLVVADADNHRIARWTHADQDPQSGAAKVEVKVDGANAQTKAPGCGTKNCAISGSWTLNANSYSAGTHKVEVIATDGVGLTKTKTLNIETHGDLVAPGLVLSGTMTEQATTSTTRNKYTLKASATDTGSAAEWKSGVVATAIKVDGSVVDSYNAPCATEGCPVTREWTMQSSEYLGSHKIQVTATDGAGRVTTKELSIRIDKDVTPPKISTGGEAFFTQPQNWLEQKTYAYTTTATDEWASGVVKFAFKIDGVMIKQAENTCSGGSCSRTLAGEINILNYAGGAHAAELVATDAAGNVAKKTWTINVDPEGQISSGEATDTLEAVEMTAPQATESTPVDGLVTAVEGDEGSNPKLVSENGSLVSSGTSVPTTVYRDADEGFSVHTSGATAEGGSQGATIKVEPVSTSGSASEAQLTDGSAAVVANSGTNTDTILRPAYDGLMAFHDIRDTTGPEIYSWVVRLGEGESLRLIDERHAGVFWDDGTLAMLITGQSAHDADGKAVSTSLSVSEGKVITLTVHHRVSGVTYPVVAGVGYEGGFQTIVAPGPPPTEQEEPDYLDGLTWTVQVSAPEPIASNDPYAGADASSNIDGLIKKWGVDICPGNILPFFDECGVWNLKFKGFYYFNFKKAWFPENRDPQCIPFAAANYDIDREQCAWVGPNNQWYGNGYHITARALWKVTEHLGITDKSSYKAVVGRAYGSGNIYFGETSEICNPSKPECV